jgi:hypothetical protein
VAAAGEPAASGSAHASQETRRDDFLQRRNSS